MLDEKNETCSSNPLWIITGVQHTKEIEYFQNYFCDRLLLVYIEASDDVRKRRGWTTVDTANAERQLDTNVQRSFTFTNNEEDSFDQQMSHLIHMINS